MKKIIYLMFLGVATLTAVSCNNFLDTNPDNRTHLTDKQKIKNILVSAYPTTPYSTVAELSSDNIYDNMGKNNPYFDLYMEEAAYWKPITQSDNDGIDYVWKSSYDAIANANMALDAIKKLGDTKELASIKAEALLCRAYNHFILANMFGHHYTGVHAGKDLAVPWVEDPSYVLNPKHTRNTVKEIYEFIDRDLKIALPDVNDDYKVPKYHFNKRAAYAFATRFYLYYGKWDEAIKHANEVLGASSADMMRDWNGLAAIPRDVGKQKLGFIRENEQANLLLIPYASSIGIINGLSYSAGRFCHTGKIAVSETLFAQVPWSNDKKDYKVVPFEVDATAFLSKVFHLKFPAIFQYTDATAGIGYYRTVQAAFSTDETILCRAEAYARNGQYDNAIADMNVWKNAMYKASTPAITMTNITNYYTTGAAKDYWTIEKPTTRQKLNPEVAFINDTEEMVVQMVLHCRRIETLNEGLRWFDLKRYGVTITRRMLNANNTFTEMDVLKLNMANVNDRDWRGAIQLPPEAIAGGLTPNEPPK